jgi:hypothetical protein
MTSKVSKLKVTAYKETQIFSRPTWVAYYLDTDGNQIGKCEYGNTKKEAVFNLTSGDSHGK